MAYADFKLRVPEDAQIAKLRICTTGHGSIGEFTPNLLHAEVNSLKYERNLWKEDVYLNPVRPQSGTWKFDRAGWAPGDVVSSWEIPISPASLEKGIIRLAYSPSLFKLKKDQKLQASHWVASQLIYYRKVGAGALK